MTTTLEISWLAGLLEGEGWFRLQDSKPSAGCFGFGLQMTDADVVVKAAKILGNVNVNTTLRDHKNNKDIYGLYISGTKAIQWMMTLYPLMGQRRQKRIEEIITFWKNYIPNPVGIKPKIDKEHYSAIISRQVQGEYPKDIAKDYNVSAETIRRICKLGTKYAR